ncbi:hypothetical protein [Nonomuraea dietziae]|uniref:Uncharacterized protein n=1 Tax=Nonomuraea dietziae TaxID=65515 RepID=A0A7W5VAT8_9ACTN|nr:hypothetical protein [Nonomuraea dietziae]MBB3730235.1 hypothetical protein [Nonomuraea dietziae]
MAVLVTNLALVVLQGGGFFMQNARMGRSPPRHDRWMGDVLIRTLAGLVMALALPATPAFACSGPSVPGGHAFTEPVVQTSAFPEITLPEIPRAVGGGAGLSASDVPVVAGPGTAAPVPQGSETAKARGSGEADDEVAFTIPDPRITESSGLALSPTHDGVVYTHNDSDAGPTFFALGPKGATRATFTLRGAQAPRLGGHGRLQGP